MGDAGDDDAAPDAPYWAITIDAAQFPASPFDQHAVTVIGVPNADVYVITDRIHAGMVFPREIFLDASGHGSATYVPCSDAIPACVGTANLEVVQGNPPPNTQPQVYATTSIELTATAGIGDISGCMGSGNAMSVRSTDYPTPPSTWQSTPSSAWTVLTYPDAARFTIDGAQRLELSLQAMGIPLATGVYTNTQLSPPSEPDRPALTIGGGGGCTAGGRYQIDEITADPTDGTLQSITVRFEASGCDDAAFAIGCLHYEAPPVTPPSPPLPDPSKVAVTVLSLTGDGTPDTSATAILTDASGTVALDTQVDSFGFAQAAVIGNGELTVIQHSGGYEYGYTYRGVHAGDHVVIHPGPVTAGGTDQMLATFPTLPANATAAYLLTACGGGSWSGGNGLVEANLTFYDGCRTPTFNMLSIAGFSDGTPQQWNWQVDVQHVANGNVQVAGAWAPFDTATVTVTNVPANTPSLAMKLSTKIGAATPQMDALRIDGPPAGDVPFTPLRYPIGAGDAMVIDLQTVIGTNVPDWITAVITGATANITLDYAADPVPLISAVQQTASGATWTETGTGSVDVRTVLWRGFANDQRVIWAIVEPYDGHASTVLPALPASHAADDPTKDPAPELHGAGALYRDYDVSSGFTLTAPPPPYRTRQTGAQTYDMQFPF